MTTNNLTCKIWATEVSSNGFAHRCHARFKGFEGGIHLKDEISEDLKRTRTQGEGAIWKLLTCEPNHDGLGCNGCPYLRYRGLSICYDLKKQTELLQESGYRR